MIVENGKIVRFEDKDFKRKRLKIPRRVTNVSEYAFQRCSVEVLKNKISIIPTNEQLEGCGDAFINYIIENELDSVAFDFWELIRLSDEKNVPQKEELYNMPVEELINVAQNLRHDFGKMVFTSGLTEKIEGRDKIEFIVGIASSIRDDNYKKEIIEKYAEEFEGRDKAEFMAEILSSIRDDNYKKEIIDNYAEEFEGRDKAEFIVRIATSTLEAYTQKEIIDNYAKEFEGKDKAEFIARIAASILLNNTKKEIIEKYAEEFEGRDKAEFIVRIVSAIIYNDDYKKEIIDRYTEEFEGTDKVKFMIGIVSAISDGDTQKETIEKYAEEFEGRDKTEFIVGTVSSIKYDDDYKKEAVDSYAEELAIQDIVKILDNKAIPSKEEIVNMSNEQLSDIIKGISNFSRVHLLAKCSEDLENDKEQEFITNVLRNIEETEDLKMIILSRFYGSDDIKNVLRVVEKSKYIIDQADEETKTSIAELKQIVQSENVEELIKTYIKLERKERQKESGKGIRNRIIDDIDSDIKAVCTQDIYDSLMSGKDLEGAKVIGKVGKQNIYDITDMQYFIFGHELNAYGHIEELNEKNLNAWNTIPLEEGRSTISVYPNTEKFSGHVGGKGSVCFAFLRENLRPGSIVDMGNRDIYITHATNATVPESAYGNNYSTAEDLMMSIFYGYGEIGLFREKQGLEQIANGEESRRIQPGAIICYDKELDEASKVYAKAFNIPILYVDTNKQAKKYGNELEEIIHNPKTYEEFSTIEKTLKQVLSFDYGLQWKENRREFINSNALNEMVAMTREAVFQGIKEMVDVTNTEQINIEQRIKSLEKLGKLIAEGHQMEHSSYYVRDYSEMIENVNARYQESRIKIEAIKAIRSNIAKNPESARHLLAGYSEEFTREEIGILQEQITLAKEKNEQASTTTQTAVQTREEVVQTKDARCVTYEIARGKGRLIGVRDEEQKTVEDVVKVIDKRQVGEIIKEIRESNSETYTDKHAHSREHVERVVIFSNMIANMEGIGETEKDLVMRAAEYHDIGRVGDGEEAHGASSATVARDELEKKGYKKEEITVICAAIEYHDRKREGKEAMEELISKYGVERKDEAKLERVAKILKDADALDRTRFTQERANLNARYLRTESSKKLVKLSYQMQENLARKELKKKGIKCDVGKSPMVILYEERAKEWLKECVGKHVGSNPRIRKEMQQTRQEQQEQ